jgi:hypothetical protein
MTAVVAAILNDERAYLADLTGEDRHATGDGSVDWRELLDLAEQLAGSTGLVALYRQYVVTDTQAGELDARAEALVQYQALAVRGGDWGVPEAVLRAMAAWEFATAGKAIADTEAALAVGDELEAELAPLGLTPTPALRQRFVEAVDLEDAETAISDELAAARRLAAARALLVEQLEQVGQALPPLTQDVYEASPEEVAEGTDVLAGQARQLADSERRVEQVVAASAVTLPALAEDAFVQAPAEAVAESRLRLDAAEAVAAATEASDDSPSLIEQVGRLGDGVDTDLAQATLALAGGDYERAIQLAGRVQTEIDEWSGRGAQRLAIAGGVAALALAVGMTTLLIRRRRHHLPPSPDATPPEPS